MFFPQTPWLELGLGLSATFRRIFVDQWYEPPAEGSLCGINDIDLEPGLTLLLTPWKGSRFGGDFVLSIPQLSLMSLNVDGSALLGGVSIGWGWTAFALDVGVQTNLTRVEVVRTPIPLTAIRYELHWLL